MSQKKIYVGFPGVGKTTDAMTRSGVIDLDFGTYRASLGVMPEKNSYLYPQFSRLVGYYIKDGWTIYTNEPGLIPYFKQLQVEVIMVLPKNKATLVERVENREKNHPVSKAFVSSLKANINSWVDDWTRIAQKYNVPIKFVNYFKEAIV